VEGLFGWIYRENLQQDLEVISPELYFYLKSKYLGLERTGPIRAEMARHALSWLKEYRPKRSEQEKYIIAQTAVTAAFKPDYYDEQWRQQAKEVRTNHAIHTQSRARKGDLGRGGFWRTKRTLPGAQGTIG
jgi:hypothetical protein